MLKQSHVFGRTEKEHTNSWQTLSNNYWRLNPLSLSPEKKKFSLNFQVKRFWNLPINRNQDKYHLSLLFILFQRKLFNHNAFFRMLLSPVVLIPMYYNVSKAPRTYSTCSWISKGFFPWLQCKKLKTRFNTQNVHCFLKYSILQVGTVKVSTSSASYESKMFYSLENSAICVPTPSGRFIPPMSNWNLKPSMATFIQKSPSLPMWLRQMIQIRNFFFWFGGAEYIHNSSCTQLTQKLTHIFRIPISKSYSSYSSLTG